MALWECAACLGVYLDTCPDGLPYYHVCPPLGVDEEGKLIPRVNARDERIDARTRGIRAEGAGRSPKTLEEVQAQRAARRATLQSAIASSGLDQDSATSELTPAERRRSRK